MCSCDAGGREQGSGGPNNQFNTTRRETHNQAATLMVSAASKSLSVVLKTDVVVDVDVAFFFQFRILGPGSSLARFLKAGLFQLATKN